MFSTGKSHFIYLFPLLIPLNFLIFELVKTSVLCYIIAAAFGQVEKFPYIHILWVFVVNEHWIKWNTDGRWIYMTLWIFDI